jgi:hypothetical protein
MTIELYADGFLHVSARVWNRSVSLPVVKTDSWLWLVAASHDAVLQCSITRNLTTRPDSVGEGKPTYILGLWLQVCNP